MTLSPASSHGSAAAALTWVDVVGGVGLDNGWVASNGFGYGTPGFALDAVNSLLYLRGGLDGSSASATTAFTLPLAYRPSTTRTNSIFNATYLSVLTTGAVQGPNGSLLVILDGFVASL